MALVTTFVSVCSITDRRFIDAYGGAILAVEAADTWEIGIDGAATGADVLL